MSIYEHLYNITQDRYVAELCDDYFKVAQFWDDLIDRDKELQDDEINQAMEILILRIPSNPFYIAHRDKILPILQVTIYKWYQANKYEATKEHLDKAYMLRAGIYDLFALCITLIKGLDTNINVYDIYGETLKDLEKELMCQTQ